MHNFPDVIIRKASIKDIAAIEQIETECFSEPWSLRAFYDYFQNETAVCFAAECGGVICGYICTYCLCGECEIVNVAVAPEKRRMGYGEQLLRTVLQYARENALFKIMLEVRFSNLAARSLYEKIGFVRVGVRKNYYSDPKEDAILMDLLLNTSQNEGEEINL